jgi:hypothetical protein
MESLSQRDVNVVLEFLRKCYASRDIDSFGRYLTSAISKVVPCKNAVFANNSSGKDKGKAETGNRGIQRALPPSGAFSGPIRPVIPFDSGHPIRCNPATYSGAFQPPPDGA